MGIVKDFRLTIELVPKPCWYSNLRGNMTRANWDKLRRSIYEKYNYHCGICQTNDAALSCHEIWQYDDENHIQRLVGFIALCPMCHHCKHIGLAGILATEGKLNLEQVIEHFMRVNQCSREEYQDHKIHAFEKWRERNMFEWTTSLETYTDVIEAPA